MKNRMNHILNGLLLVACFALPGIFAGCNDYTGEYEMTGGEPTIYYVRPTDANKADSLLVGAYMGETVCLVGENLTSIHELYFNDVKATLNINFITKNTLIVTVPTTIPEDKTDKIYMKLSSGGEATYDFITRIPNPTISRILCDNVPEGGKVVLLGDYFLDYPDAPISVSIGNYTVPHEDIVSVEKTRMSFLAPPADVKGYISVKTSFGSNGRSYRDLFRDGDESIVQFITGFEDSENGGTGFVGGWGRPGPLQIQSEPELALSGNYVRWAGSLTGGEWSSGTPEYALNIWGCDDTANPNSGIPNPMFTFSPETAVLKFDINVLTPWSGLPIIICFDAPGTAENYLWADGTMPRAFYAPWETAEGNSFTTDGWETVSIPISDIKYVGNGSVAKDLDLVFSNLNIAMHNRGAGMYAGTDCSPVILIDNIRVIDTK